MANVLGPPIPSILNSATLPLPPSFCRPNRENPTLVGIRSRHQVEQAQRQAEQAAKGAQELAERIQRQADKAFRRASACQIEADRAVERSLENVKELKSASKVSQRAQELAKEARKATGKDATKLVQKARKERRRSQRMYQDADMVIAASKKREERALNVSQEKHRAAEASVILAKKMSDAAEEETQEVMEKNEEVIIRLKEGIQPVVTPSHEEVVAAKWRTQYTDDYFHFAVVGVSGKRKSSLVNAFRGICGGGSRTGAARAKKATLQLTRYPDVNPKKPLVWYDIPNVGTLKCPDWQYFNNQGLYVFDGIIIVFDYRLSGSDIAILANARRFDIPTYIIRDNANHHIRRILKKRRRGKKGGDKGDAENRSKLYEAAREQFIEETRKRVQANLKHANLPDQRVYIISKTTLLNVEMNKTPKKIIDEVGLFRDILTSAYLRRFDARLAGMPFVRPPPPRSMKSRAPRRT